MSRVVTYEVTLEIDVEVEDEIPQEMNFSTFVEDGTLSVYAKHGEDTLVGCVQVNNKIISVGKENDWLFPFTLEVEWEVCYANGVRKTYCRSFAIDENETWEDALADVKIDFKEYLLADSIAYKAPIGELIVTDIRAYVHGPHGDEYKDGDTNLKFHYTGKEVAPVI